MKELGECTVLTELRIKLESENSNIGYYQSSNLQGILMEQIDEDYAEAMHRQGLKPYSQYVLNKGGTEWVIHTYTEEAYEKIILPLMRDDFTNAVIEKKEISFRLAQKQLHTRPMKELLEEFYSVNGGRYFNIDFLTPASFKSGGRYVIMPEMRYIYQSLMNKYSAVSREMEMYDEETLEQLSENSEIVRYRLQSSFFPLEGVRVPAFIGSIGVKIRGSDTMARYARLLFRFGEYSGIGIKTAIGMGAVRIREGIRKHD